MQVPSLSPSLQSATFANGNPNHGAMGAYEVKFLVERNIAEQLLVRANAVLAIDPFCTQTARNGAPGIGYWIESLYLDSAEFAVFHRLPGYSRRKYRIRRYGDSDSVFLERKRKRRGLVSKRRSSIRLSELSKLAESTPLSVEWDAGWFQRRLIHRKLRPTMRVGYFRRALMGQGEFGTLRLTYDTDVRCDSACDFAWPALNMQSSSPNGNLFANYGILEMKFRQVLPPVFREWIDVFGLRATSCSKYRSAIETIGMATERPSGVLNMDAITGQECKYV